MEGKFIKKPLLGLWYSVGLISGLSLDGLFGFIFWKEGFSGSDIDTKVLGLFLLAFGAFAAVFSARMLTGELHMRLCVDKQCVDGVDMFGKTLSCPLSSVKAVVFGSDSLSITRADGKRFHFHRLENAAALYCWLLRHSAANRQELQESEVDPTRAHERFLAIRTEQRRRWKRIIRCFLLMIVLLILALLLLGDRDMKDFNARDWGIFAALLAPGLAALALTLASLVRNLQLSEELQRKEDAFLQTSIQRKERLVRMELLQANRRTAALAVYALPQEQGYYFCLEALDEQYELETLQRSRVYDTLAALETALEASDQITRQSTVRL